MPAKRPDPLESSEGIHQELEEQEENAEVNSKRQKSESESEQTLSCPICNRTMRNMDNAQLNRHVDECLNRDTVKSIVSSLSSSQNSNSNNSRGNTAPASKNPAIPTKSLLDYYYKSS